MSEKSKLIFRYSPVSYTHLRRRKGRPKAVKKAVRQGGRAIKYVRKRRRHAEQTKAIPEYPAAGKEPLQREKTAKTTPADNTLQRMVDREAKRAEGKGAGYDLSLIHI